MKSWISSRTNKPASRLPEEDAEVVKEEEAITTDAEIVEAEADVAAVEEAVVAAVAVVEETWLRKTREKQTASAWFCQDEKGGRIAVEHMKRICAIV
jgi:hypothetical protein